MAHFRKHWKKGCLCSLCGSLLHTYYKAVFNYGITLLLVSAELLPHKVHVPPFGNSHLVLFFSEHILSLSVFCKLCKTALKIWTFLYQLFLNYLACLGIHISEPCSEMDGHFYCRGGKKSFKVRVTLHVGIQWKLLEVTMESSALCSG